MGRTGKTSSIKKLYVSPPSSPNASGGHFCLLHLVDSTEMKGAATCVAMRNFLPLQKERLRGQARACLCRNRSSHGQRWAKPCGQRMMLVRQQGMAGASHHDSATEPLARSRAISYASGHGVWDQAPVRGHPRIGRGEPKHRAEDSCQQPQLHGIKRPRHRPSTLVTPALCTAPPRLGTSPPRRCEPVLARSHGGGAPDVERLFVDYTVNLLRTFQS
jgi:hypothetical protein